MFSQNVDPTKKLYTVKSRTLASRAYKPDSSIRRYFLKKRYLTLLQGLDYKPGHFFKFFGISQAYMREFTVIKAEFLERCLIIRK